MAEEADLTVDDLGVVLEELYGARTDWYNMGLKLRVKVVVLNSIRSQWSSPKECFRDMLMRYLQTVTPSPSWRALVETLRSPTVDQPQLAEKVEQRYCRALQLKGSPADNQPISNALSQQHVEPKYCPICGLPSSPSGFSPGGSAQNSTNECSTDEKQQPRDYGCGCGKCSFQSVLAKGCPEPVQSMSSFPYLIVDGLSESDKRSLRGRLRDEYKKISLAFASLVANTIRSLTKQEIPVQNLVQILIALNAFQPIATIPRKPLLEERLEELRKCNTIDDVFSILRDYMSFYSHHIIDYIIDELGTDKDQQSLKMFKNKLNDYCKRSIFECPFYSSARNTDRTKPANLIFKIAIEDSDLERYNIEDLEIFQSHISNIIKISKYTLQLVTVAKGCLQLTYRIPQCIKKIIITLLAGKKKEFHAIGVILLSCDDYEFISNKDFVPPNLLPPLLPPTETTSALPISSALPPAPPPSAHDYLDSLSPWQKSTVLQRKPPPGIRYVTLERPDLKTSFGFVVLSLTRHEGCVISRLIPDSPAHLCGQLFIMDDILAVNGEDVCSLEHTAILVLIKNSGTTVQLTVQQPTIIIKKRPSSHHNLPIGSIQKVDEDDDSEVGTGEEEPSWFQRTWLLPLGNKEAEIRFPSSQYAYIDQWINELLHSVTSSVHFIESKVRFGRSPKKNSLTVESNSELKPAQFVGYKMAWQRTNVFT